MQRKYRSFVFQVLAIGNLAVAGSVLSACGTNEVQERTNWAHPAAQFLKQQSDKSPVSLSLTQSECSDSKVLDQIKVSSSGSLLINDLAVLSDSRTKVRGPWSFAFLMREILELDPNPGTDAAKLKKEDLAIKNFVDQFVTQTQVNSFVAPQRTQTKNKLLQNWPKRRGSDGVQYLNFESAPLSLVGITNRLDIVKKDQVSTSGGEGRFIFEFLPSVGVGTVILEYDLPIGALSLGNRSVTDWAKSWDGLKAFLVDTDATRPGVQPKEALGALQFQDKSGYLSALQAITDSFTKRNSQKITGSTLLQAAISQIRTNEFVQSPWELRELKRQRTANAVSIALSTVKNNPAVAAFRSSTTAAFRNFDRWVTNNVTCRAGATARNGCSYNTPTGELPQQFLSGSTQIKLLGASAPNDLSRWFAGSADVKKRFVALNTCDGCHGPETNTSFVHLSSTGPSAFLRDDVERRKLNLKNLLCLSAPSTTALGADSSASQSKSSIESLGPRIGTSSSTH